MWLQRHNNNATPKVRASMTADLPRVAAHERQRTRFKPMCRLAVL
jgi:hypothetical protein